MLIVLIVVAVLIAAVFALLLWPYFKTFYSPTRDMSETELPPILTGHPYNKESRGYIKELSGLPCEFVTTRSFDGLRLSARYYRGREGMPLCICFHGYRGSAVRDFSGGGLFLIHEGYHVLIVDERAHWRSQGHTITFGVKERYDVLSWVDFANSRFGADMPVFLFGISMGGGTVLMASGLELPDNVRGIVADCPFNSPKEIILHVCRKIKMNPTLSWPLIWASAHVYGHFNINAITAADAVKKATKPILIIHGEGDDFVPADMSREVQERNPGLIRRVTFPEAGHGLSFLYDTARYEAVVREFLASCG